ncbi:MAG: DoxX family membrane protein [Candidatus Margulisiibacteriota bacterium]
MLKKLLNTAKKHSKFENTVEFIRIYLGIGLFFKGVHFMVNPQDLVYFLNQGQLNVIESFISHYVISAHLVGGLLLTFGLLTRVGALIQIPVLIGALGIVHASEMLFSTNQNFEFTALVLFLLVIFSIIGAGNISLDHHILKEDSDEKPWIEEKLKQLFAKEGHLALVRISSKIQQKPKRLKNKNNT